MLIKIGGIEIRTGADKTIGALPPPQQSQPQHTSTIKEHQEDPYASPFLLPPPERDNYNSEKEKNVFSQEQKRQVKSYSDNTSAVTIGCRNPHSLTRKISFPVVQGDPWRETMMLKIVDELNDAFKSGWVSVCPLHDFEKQFDLFHTPRSKEAYEKIRALHCIHFDKIHPEILKELPGLYSEVFRAAIDPFDANTVVDAEHGGW